MSKTQLLLYPFNIYNLQKPKTHLPLKEKLKSQFPFFNSGSNSRSVLVLNAVNFEVWVNWKVLDLRVLFLWLQELGQFDIKVKRYDQNTETS